MPDRREFISKSVAVAVPTAVLGGMWYARNREYTLDYPLTDKDVEKARRHPIIRQEFWDRFLEQYPITGCERLVDDPIFSKSREYHEKADKEYRIITGLNIDPNAFAVLHAPLQITGRGLKLPAFIGNRIWNVVYSDTGLHIFDKPEVMASIIVDHEGVHVTDLSLGYVIDINNVITYRSLSDPYKENFLQDLAECRAYRNQTKKMEVRGFPEGVLVDIIPNTCKYAGRLFFHSVRNENTENRRYARLQLDAFQDISFEQISDKTVIVNLKYLGEKGKMNFNLE